MEEIRDFIHDEKLNGAVKLSTDNIHQIMTVLIEMIEKRHRILSIDVSVWVKIQISTKNFMI